MAKQQFDPNDAKLLALEIEKIYKRMGQLSPFKSSVHTINELKEGLEEARDMFMDWQDGIGDIEAGFQLIAERHQGVDLGHDAVLFGEGWEGYKEWCLLLYADLIASGLGHDGFQLALPDRALQNVIEIATVQSYRVQPIESYRSTKKERFNFFDYASHSTHCGIVG